MTDISNPNPVEVTNTAIQNETIQTNNLSGLDDILDKVASGDFEIPKMNDVEDIADLVPDDEKVPVHSQPQTSKRKQNLGRKNIRKIDETCLDDVVLKAQQAESERLKRISDKEKTLPNTSENIPTNNSQIAETSGSPSPTDVDLPPSKIPRLTTETFDSKLCSDVWSEKDMDSTSNDEDIKPTLPLPVSQQPFSFSDSPGNMERYESKFDDHNKPYGEQIQRKRLSRPQKSSSFAFPPSLLPPASSLPPSVLPPASSRFSNVNSDHSLQRSMEEHNMEHRMKMNNFDPSIKKAPLGYEMSSSGLLYKSFSGDSMDNAIMLGDSDDEDFDLLHDDDFNSDFFTSEDEEHQEVIELSDADDEEDVNLDDLSEEAREDAQCMTFDEFGRILINKGHPENEQDFFLAPQIANTIKPHQVSGIRFLYDNVVESLEQFESEGGFGCILAHSMGLGKTIQIIGFLDVLFRCVQARSALIIVPINTLQNWQAEIEMWLPVQTENNQSQNSKPPAQTENNQSQNSKPPAQTENNQSQNSKPPAQTENNQSQNSKPPAQTENNQSQNSKPPAPTENNQSQNSKPVQSDNPSDSTDDQKVNNEGDTAAPQEENSTTTPRPFTLYVVKDTLKSMEARYQVVQAWHENGGVLLIGYEMFRLVVGRKNPNKKASSLNKRKKPISIDIEVEEKKASMWEGFYQALVNPGPQIVICDEGHRIKNSEASISKALKAIRTRRRIVMTGYPLQNNLIEYWCMVDFVRPNYLGTKQNFTNMFQRPIENGQCIDSTEGDRKLMQGRAHVLHELLAGFVQRRSHAVLKASLPKKQEVVLLIKMSAVQRKLYSSFMDSLSGRGLFAWAQNNTLNTYAVCCKIWNHPDVLWRVVQDLHAKDDAFDFDIEESSSNGVITPSGSQTTTTTKSSKQKNKKRPVIHSASTPAFNRAANCSGTASGDKISGGFGVYSDNSSSAANEDDQTNFPTAQSVHSNPYVAAYMAAQPEPGMNYEWLSNDIWPDYAQHVADNGGKIVLFLSLLKESVLAGDKMLLFSQSLLTLDLIETFLKILPLPDCLQPSDAEPDSKPTLWTKNHTYYRLDGSTSASERERLINSFNLESNKAKLFLLSTRAGCLGVNLVGANRVVVFDASWNPCHDCQAVCRVYRYGQTKQCYIYRLVSDNTMEKKIYDRQVAKQGMSDRVVDELNPGQQFTRQQVEQLMDYEDKNLETISPEQIDQWTNCEDDLLKKVLHDNTQWITKLPFSHESLLIDQRDYRLTRYEKMRAKQRYEEEKRQQLFQRPMYMDFYPRGPIPMPPIDHRPSILSRPRPGILSGGNFRSSGMHQPMMSSFEQMRHMNRQARISAFTMQMEEARRRYNLMKNGSPNKDLIQQNDDVDMMSNIPPPPSRLSFSRELEARNQKMFPISVPSSELKEPPVSSHNRSLLKTNKEVSQMMNSLITNKPTITKPLSAGNTNSLNKPGNSTAQSSDCKITRIQATTDLFFPGTTTVTNSQRKIAKGEVMEVIQTSKSKYLRVPRTGDLYVVRTNSNLPNSEASSTDSLVTQTTFSDSTVTSTVDASTSRPSVLDTSVSYTAEYLSQQPDYFNEEDSTSQPETSQSQNNSDSKISAASLSSLANLNSFEIPKDDNTPTIDHATLSIITSSESKLDCKPQSEENSMNDSFRDETPPIIDSKSDQEHSGSAESTSATAADSVIKDQTTKEDASSKPEAINSISTGAATNSTLDSIISLVAAGGGTNELPDRRTLTNQMKDTAGKDQLNPTATEASPLIDELINSSPVKPKPKRVRPPRSKKKVVKTEPEISPTSNQSNNTTADQMIGNANPVKLNATHYQSPAAQKASFLSAQPANPPKQTVERGLPNQPVENRLPSYSSPAMNDNYQQPYNLPPQNPAVQPVQSLPPPPQQPQQSMYQNYPQNQNFVNVSAGNNPSSSMLSQASNPYSNYEMKPDITNVNWQVQNTPMPPPQHTNAMNMACCGCSSQMMNPNCRCNCHAQNNQYSNWMAPPPSQNLPSSNPSNHTVQTQPITNYYQINSNESINAPQMMPTSANNMQQSTFDNNFPAMVANAPNATSVYFYQNAPGYQAPYADPYVNTGVNVNASYVQQPQQTTIYAGPQSIPDQQQLVQSDSEYFYTTQQQPQFQQQQSQPVNSIESSREFYFPEL